MAALLGALLRTSRKAGRQAPNAVPVDYLVRVWQAARLTHGDAQATGLAEDLTDREREVLGMLAAGKRNQVIATELVVTLDTVKKHVTHTLKKLGAANRTEAVARARQLGLLP
jgi:LuxR family maltose regulon positive regulatory protein